MLLKKKNLICKEIGAYELNIIILELSFFIIKMFFLCVWPLTEKLKTFFSLWWWLAPFQKYCFIFSNWVVVLLFFIAWVPYWDKFFYKIKRVCGSVWRFSCVEKRFSKKTIINLLITHLYCSAKFALWNRWI